MLDVEIKQVPTLHLAGVRHIGPYPEIGAAFDRIFTWAAERGLHPYGADGVGVYHDDPSVTPPEQLRSDACVICDAAFAGDEDAGVGVVELPAGEAAVAIHAGPYEGLPGAWRWLYGEWLVGSGRTPSDAPSYEVYLNDPSDTASEDLRTALHVPLA